MMKVDGSCTTKHPCVLFFVLSAFIGRRFADLALGLEVSLDVMVIWQRADRGGYGRRRLGGVIGLIRH